MSYIGNLKKNSALSKFIKILEYQQNQTNPPPSPPPLPAKLKIETQINLIVFNMFCFRITLGGSGASSTSVRPSQGNSKRGYILIFYYSTRDCVTCNAVRERNTRAIR